MISILDDVTEKASYCYGNPDLKHPVVIAYGEDGFEMPMGVSMTSILRHHPDQNIVFHVLTEGKTIDFPMHLERLAALANHSTHVCIYVHVLDTSALDHLPTTMVISKATYYRFLLDRLVGDVSFVIYMDSDILCLRPMNFSEIFDENVVLSAVKDLPEVAEESEKRLGISASYFNAGFLVINLPRWRELQIVSKTMDYLAQHPNIKHMDQDALNAVLAMEGEENIKYLPDTYNFEYDAPTAERVPMPENVILLHYIAEKPWYPWVDHPARRFFFAEKTNSSWRDTPLPSPCNYKQRHRMALHCMRNHKWAEGMKWYVQYVVSKPVERWRNRRKNR